MSMALRDKLLPVGDGRHRTLTEPERVVLAHLLAGPDRFRVTLAAMARELFGQDRPALAASRSGG
jgi:predicted ATPase